MKISVFVLLLFLFFNCADKDNAAKPLLHYVPENSFLIIKIENHEDFKTTIENNDFIADLAKSNSYDSIRSKLRYLNYIAPKSEAILALTETTDNHFEFFYITHTAADLIHLDSIQNRTVESIAFANTTLDKYTIDNSSFYSLITNQKVIISSSKLLLEKLEKNISVPRPKSFEKLFQITNKNKPATVFLNMNNSNSLLSTLTKEKSKLQFTGFSDWISLDINDKRTNLNLSGISIANDSTYNYIDLLAHTKPVENQTATFAPLKADAILSYTFADYAIFAKNREVYSGIVSPVEPPMDAVEEIGIIYMNDEKAIVLNTYGTEEISEYLMGQKKEAIEYQGQEIMELHKNDFLTSRFSPLVKDYKMNFCVFLKNAFVFSNSQSTLKTIVSNYKKSNTFNNSSIFKTLNRAIAKESSILFVSNSEHIEKIIKENFKPSFSDDISKIKLSKYGFAAQTITDKSFYHTNIVIEEIENETNLARRTSSLFKVNLEADLATNPQLVTNHKTGRKEIIVQDQNNVLYLISNKGKILWKKQLSSLVQGKINQVDLFKNGRLQFAFTTNNQFMILDRKGQGVKDFTTTYEGGNLNALAVFDYEKKKNYRFVVTQKEKIFMYDNKAKIVKGFKYIKAEQPVIATPKHVVIGNKDFLVFKLKDGTLKLLNRVGDERVKLTEKIDFSENEIFSYKNKFTVSNKKGVLHQIDLKGKITKTNFNLSNDHGMVTTENTLVLMNENILTIKGKKIELELGVYSKPQIFYLNKKIYVSVTDLQNEKVYLFDSQAKGIAGFPIIGASKIDLSATKNGKTLELVTKKDHATIEVYSF